MTHSLHNIDVAKNIGRYSDAVETKTGLRWLFSAGTPGMTKTGDVPPDIEGQSRLAWKNVLEILNAAGMSTRDLVKVTTSLTDAKYIQPYAKIRSEFLGDERPAFMLQIVSGLIRPDVLVEIEIIAAAG